MGNVFEETGKRRLRDILVQARDLLSQPYGWTKGEMSRSSKRAASGRTYCALGAIRHVTSDDRDYQAARRVVDDVVRYPGGGGIMGFNDNRHTRKAEVLAAFDTAIAEAS